MLPGAMVSEEVHSDVTELPRRGSPLPWLLLAVTLIVAVGIFAMARGRLNDERLRTATALKANDEVMARLRNVANEYAKTQISVGELEARKDLLEKQVHELDEKTKALGVEVQELKKKKR